MNKKLAIAAAALVTIGIAGCSSGGTATSQKISTVTKTATVTAEPTDNAAPADPDADLAADESAEDTSDTGGVQLTKFGSTENFKGWSVTVTSPKAFVPSDTAYIDAKSPAYRVVSVTVKNTTKNRALDADDISVGVNVDGNDGASVSDIDKLTDPPTSKILPGLSATWQVAFGVKPTSAINVQVEEFLGDTVVIFKA